MYGNQLYHHQHAMQRIRWERRRNLGRGSQKEIWRDSGGFLAQAGRPQSGPRSQFTDSCGSQWLAGQLLPPKPSLAPAKAMTQFSRKSLKVKVQWTWAAAAALGLRAKQATPFNKSLHCAHNASHLLRCSPSLVSRVKSDQIPFGHRFVLRSYSNQHRCPCQL